MLEHHRGTHRGRHFSVIQSGRKVSLKIFKIVSKLHFFIEQIFNLIETNYLAFEFIIHINIYNLKKMIVKKQK